MDILELLSQLQDAALSPGATDSLSGRQRIVVHATIAGAMFLLAKISSNQQLRDHVLEVVARRRDSAPHLLPDSLLATPTPQSSTEGVDGMAEESRDMSPDHLFQLREKGIIQSVPEPKKGYGMYISCQPLLHSLSLSHPLTTPSPHTTFPPYLTPHPHTLIPPLTLASFGDLQRQNSQDRPELGHHFSVSVEYGPESPVRLPP